MSGVRSPVPDISNCDPYIHIHALRAALWPRHVIWGKTLYMYSGLQLSASQPCGRALHRESGICCVNFDFFQFCYRTSGPSWGEQAN